MIPILEIIFNGHTMIEYQRNTRLPGKQRELLDIMDIDMDKGFHLDGELISSPTNQQRAHYVVMKLFQALKSNNKGLINASCAYLANRQPGLQQVRINEEGEAVSLELVFE